MDETTLGYQLLWPTTMITIGVTALSAWALGARIYFSAHTARKIRQLATLVFIGYCLIVLMVTQDFAVAIIHYLPGALFLSLSLALKYRQTKEKKIFLGLCGMGLILIGSGFQQARVTIHPTYFNHNALYHLIQGVALFMIFKSAQWFVAQNGKEEKNSHV